MNKQVLHAVLSQARFDPTTGADSHQWENNRRALLAELSDPSPRVTKPSSTGNTNLSFISPVA